jgi:hypothetical protein
MPSVFEEPPPEPDDDWTEEEWRAWLVEAPADPETGHAHPLSRMRSTAGGALLSAAMLALERAIYGERPEVEIVVEASSDGLDLGDIELDPDDPARSRMQLGEE